MNSYSKILRSAWEITKKFKFLWLWGFFASFISLEAVYEIIFSQINQARAINIFHQKVLNLYQSQVDFLQKYILPVNTVSDSYLTFFLFIVLVVISLIFIFFIFAGQIYIIKSVAHFYRDKTISHLELMGHSLDKFWSVLGINVLVKTLLYLGFMLLNLPLLYFLIRSDSNGITAASLFFFLTFTLLAIILSFISAYATNLVILQEQNIIGAFKYAWKIFSNNIGISLKITLILFVFKIVSLLAILILISLPGFPLFILLVISLTSNSLAATVLILVLLLVTILIVSLLINSIFNVFYLSTWTITFLEITEASLFGRFLVLIKSIPTLLAKEALKNKIKIHPQNLKRETKAIAYDLHQKYQEAKPFIKKQQQQLKTEFKKIYEQVEPKVKKHVQKLISQHKKKIAVPAKAKKTTTAQKRKSKKVSTSKK